MSSINKRNPILNEIIKWRYGDSWEKFPIEKGEIWSAGDNRFLCGDIMEITPDEMNDLLCYKKADIVYVDPPWNQSNISAFRTKANLTEYQKFEDFLRVLVRLIKETCATNAYMEMGRQNVLLTKKTIEEMGGRVLGIFNITYYRVKPCKLIRFTFNDMEEYPPMNLDGIDDDYTPLEVMRIEQPDSVLDLCIGRGLTARLAYKQRPPTICYGVELNKRRLANVIDFYSQRGLRIHKRVELNKESNREVRANEG